MKFRFCFLNAIKFSFLVIILIWSFTWNSNDDETQSLSDYSKAKSSQMPEDGRFGSKGILNKDVSSSKATLKMRYKPEKSSEAASITDGIIPPFNEWKELEKIKYEQKYTLDPPVHNQKVSGKRKLNYASSKCGAKILASNPESRHKLAILNEKPDEYMMNPCRVRTWFIIELCDTVEATQVEIANYELYSSSPREFSVFWSEIYPTTEWRLLGTFEAKDQRTMQTFNLSLKNLGKFIKVIIYNHHGKEHFCLLSVIRIIGYSMVENFEDLHKSNDSPEHNDIPSEKTFIRNSTSENKTAMEKTTDVTGDGNSNIPSMEQCSTYFAACDHQHGANSEIIFLDEQTCRFFMTVIKKFSFLCEKNYCHTPATYFNASSYKCELITKEYKNFQRKSTTKNGLTREVSVPPNKCALKNKIRKQKTVPEVDSYDQKDLDKRGRNDFDKSTRSENTTRNRLVDVIHKTYKESEELKCTCEAKVREKEMKEASLTVQSSYEDDGKHHSYLVDGVDSAGLIQKESVLYKLTTRIKASEIDLNLINKYLQQLSQSYRQQMQDLQAMFNETVKAINVASEMSIQIERKQQEGMNNLQQKVTSLTRKVEYLMAGHHNMINRVVEMHMFFIILEIIIISTIFTIFLNIYNRKRAISELQHGEKIL